jgi:hypothetical protein
MNLWSDIQAREQRGQDLLREAERERLARQAPSATNDRLHFYDQTLAALGRRLVDWGCRLQERARTALRLAQRPAVRLQTEPPCPCPDN